MNVNELRTRTLDELQGDLIALLKQQFNLRMRKATGQLNQTHLLKKVKRDIARVKMIQTQKAGE